MHFPKLYSTLLFIVFFFKFSLSLQDSCNNIKDYSSLFLGLNVEQEYSYVVGKDYVSSAQWIFRGNYLTVAIDQNENGLAKPDCSVGGPFIEITTEQSDVPYKGCFKRLVTIENPIVSSNEVKIRHCSGIANTSFKFSVTSKLGGYFYVTKEKQNFNVIKKEMNKPEEEQWIAFKLLYPNQILSIRLTDISITHSNKGNCGKGFLIMKDASDQTLKKLCNNNRTYDKVITMNVTESDVVNVTFKRAGFKVEVGAILPISAASSTTKSVAAGPSGRINKQDTNPTLTVRPSTEESESAHSHSEHDEHTNMLLYIGLSLAIAVVIGLVIFIFSIVRHRKYIKAKRELRERSQVTSMTALPTTTTNGQLPQNNSLNSMSNAMYDQIVEGNDRASATNNGPDNQWNNTIADSEASDKRRLRLSQLADKYIDVDLLQGQRSQNDPNRLTNMLHRPHHDHTSSNPKATFNSSRPPMPIPQLAQSSSSNKYESIDSPLSAKDLVSPAYSTVDEGHVGFIHPDAEKPGFGKRFVDGNYKIPTNRQLSKIPMAQYESSELLGDNDLLDENKNNFSLISDPENSSYPRDANDGYLSVTESTKRKQSPINMYVSPNRVSSKSVDKQYQKPAPRSRTNFTTTSMPSLLDDETSKNLKNPPPKPSRKKDLSAGAKPSLDVSPSRHIATDQYQAPRPSAPNIFVKSAYTSTDDIDSLRTRLQKIHDQALLDAESDSRLSLPASETILYASPRSSAASSVASLTGQPPQDFYATPRPSLPQIFPGESNRLMADNAWTTQL